MTGFFTSETIQSLGLFKTLLTKIKKQRSVFLVESVSYGQDSGILIFLVMYYFKKLFQKSSLCGKKVA